MPTESDPRPAGLSRFRVPLGSLVVDATLVAALAWWGATMQTRFEESAERFRATDVELTQRLSALQAQVNSSDGSAKFAAIEAKIAIGERDRLELKTDINARLERIEDKLDRALR